MIRDHTDVVGSLLRPGWLLDARRQLDAGAITPDQFATVENRAVDEAISLQERAGLGITTDGEMRRLSFRSRPRNLWVKGPGFSDGYWGG